MSKDASDLMHLREDGLRYVVVNSGVIEHLIQTQGMDRARVMLLISRWLDNTLGPPVLSAYQARVYRVPDEEQGAAMLRAQLGTSGPTETDHVAPIPMGDSTGAGDTPIDAPSFEDLEQAFSPGYGEP